MHAGLPFREPVAPRDDWPSNASDLAEVARSQWGLWDDELDGVSQTQLLESYVLRVRWESEVLATAVIRRLAEAMGGTGTENPRQSKVEEPGKMERVSSDTFLQMMGIKLHGHKPS